MYHGFFLRQRQRLSDLFDHRKNVAIFHFLFFMPKEALQRKMKRESTRTRKILVTCK